MASPQRFYWDSCAWLGVLNGESDKRVGLEALFRAAKGGSCQLWTSTFSLVEVNRYSSEEHKVKPLDEANLRLIEEFFQQPFIRLVPVDMVIAGAARRLIRETRLAKGDAIHLASALQWSVDAMHTYDGADLLHHSEKFRCRSGSPLVIRTPCEEANGPLFAQANIR